jgi:O-antigen ligase
VLAALFVVLGFRQSGWKGSLAMCLIGGALAGMAWTSSPYLRIRVNFLVEEIAKYRERGEPTSAGQRLEFWQKSAEFIAEKPVFGHGTGTIETLFRRAATASPGPDALVTANPHSQVLGVAVQLGIAGAGLLVAMWLAHLALFRAVTPMAWIGFVVVAQNILGSLFNSHISDFTQGWLYVIGVGVLGAASPRRPKAADTA